MLFSTSRLLRRELFSLTNVVDLRQTQAAQTSVGSGVTMAEISPPRHLVWSTDRIDLDDPFQRRWYIRQVLTHGRAQDVAVLDLDEVARLLEELNLPPEIYSLWARFLEYRRAAR